MLQHQQPIPVTPPGKHAFFFDVDGTLAPLQPTPELVTVSAEVCNNLQLLFQKSGGAVAIISGRPLIQIDQLLSPVLLPAAGVHGAERRDNNGMINRMMPGAELLTEAEQQLKQGISGLPGVRLEKKGIAFALHYRQAKQFAEQTEALARTVVSQIPELTLVSGKCVVELKPSNIDKGKAIAQFMHSAPFHGRIPVFLGDDLTDERGFSVVNNMGGISVKIGKGKSQAKFRLENTAEVHQWIASILNSESRQSQPTKHDKESPGWTD